MSSKLLRKLQKFLGNEREERRNVTQIKNGGLGSLLGVACSLYPQCMIAVLQNQQAKLAGNAARTPILASEISVHAQKISSKVL
jgi:hypothetical protein